MSVMTIDLKEFAGVASTILYVPEYHDLFYSLRERAFHNEAFKPTSEQTKISILAFVERLYIANNLAFSIQYPDSDTITIERLTEKDLQGALMHDHQFLETLESIHYNLYTNEGRCFLGREDEERLERYINHVKDRILRSITEVSADAVPS